MRPARLVSAGAEMGNEPISLAGLLAAAPHRLLFLVGATNVLAAMTWWTCWLLAARWHLAELPQPALPAGWLHAIIMQYQVLPSFIFGFLLTVFPRWMNLAPIAPRHYLPVGVGLLGGQLLTLAGLAGNPWLLRAGAAFTVAGWLVGLVLLSRRALQAPGWPWHALSCLLGLVFGFVGLGCYLLLTFRPDAQLAFVAIKFGGVAMLLPIYFTVCHRMIPFFTQMALPGYQPARPLWVLAAAWVLLLTHLGLELRHGYSWLWLADAPLACLFAGLLIAWWPRQKIPPLLRVLYLGFAWLPEETILPELRAGQLKALPLEGGAHRTAQLYASFADPEFPGRDVARLAEILRERAATACLKAKAAPKGGRSRRSGKAARA